MTCYIGLMSGTSADGVDGVLIEFKDGNAKILDTEFFAYPKELKQSVQLLQHHPDQPYNLVCRLNVELGQYYSVVANTIKNKNPDYSIRAIGCHGQTIQHRPYDDVAYSLQIGSGAVIAQATQITTVNNFRAADIANGGQGAPFAPAFHKALFGQADKSRVIVNIGGIANLSYLRPNHPVMGFDTGPGNTLMDYVCETHFGKQYDANGDIASKGTSHAQLLDRLMSDVYFSLKPPKSTGQELFNSNWLTKHLALVKTDIRPIDLLSTLSNLTARSIAKSITEHCDKQDSVYICGGGAKNTRLLNRISEELQCPIHSTTQLGIDADWVEASGFAWLAMQAIEDKSVDLTSVTGSSQPTKLGSIWRI